MGDCVGAEVGLPVELSTALSPSRAHAKQSAGNNCVINKVQLAKFTYAIYCRVRGRLIEEAEEIQKRMGIEL